MNELTITKIENDSSIEIEKNTKGHNFTVKAYGSTEIEIANKLKNLLATAKQTIKELEATP